MYKIKILTKFYLSQDFYFVGIKNVNSCYFLFKIANIDFTA